MDEILDQVRAAITGIWRQRWWALMVAILIGIAGTAYVMRIPARYEASARVYVDTQSILQPLMSGITVRPNVEQQVLMIGRTLISRPNVERVMRMADLDLQATTGAEREQLIDSLTNRIRFSAAGGAASNLYTIALADERPEVARRVVQSFLSIFVESNLGNKRRDSEQARKFIDDQIRQYEERLTDSETKLKEFRIRNMASMPSLAQDSFARSAEIQARLTQARMEMQEAESARDELKKQIAGETPLIWPVDDMPSTVSSSTTTELDIRIASLRKDLDAMLSRFTDQHPDVIGTRRILGDLERQRDAERKAEAARLAAARAAQPQQPFTGSRLFQELRLVLAESEARLASLRGRVSSLEGQLAQARRVAQAIPKVELEYAQLTREHEMNRRNYDAMLVRQESAKLTGDMEGQAGLADFRVIDPPRVGSKPVSPNRPLLMAAVLGMSIAAGIGLAFIKDLLKPVYHDLRNLRAATGLPILGAVSIVVDARTRMRRRLGVAAFSGTALLYVGAFAALIVYQYMRVQVT